MTNDELNGNIPPNFSFFIEELIVDGGHTIQLFQSPYQYFKMKNKFPLWFRDQDVKFSVEEFIKNILSR